MTALPSDRLLEDLLALHPRLIDLSLDRMWRVLAALGHPQDKCPPVIHIAGTNGKGSTAAMLRAMLEAAGHKVHAYHSPHLVRFHERIILGGEPISEAHLADVLARTQAANGGRPITFFEVTTAAAFLAFAEQPADYLVLEVGLGGRLDATNVLTPKLSAVTPVSRDHEEFLGDTLLSIAEEKAGILKAGVPAVSGLQTPEVAEFLTARAARNGTPLLLAGRDFTARPDGARWHYAGADAHVTLPRPALDGAHQLDNAAVAVTLARALGIGPEAMAVGLETVRWPARLQKLKSGPLVTAVKARLPQAEIRLDGGHNEAAAAMLAAWLAAQADARPCHLVTGLLSSKAHDAFLQAFAGTGVRVHAVPIAGNDAALPPEILAESAAAAGLNATAHDSVEAALAAIDAPDALILIAGSLYLAGAVLAENA